jgi:hypothetical protein
MEAIYNMDINELNQDFIELLKKMFIGAKLQIIVHTDLASNDLYKLANDSFSEVWEGEHNEHWDNFLKITEENV